MTMRPTPAVIVWIALFCVVLAALPVAAETTVESEWDRGSGLFTLTVRRDLDPGMNPQDHPRILNSVERDLPSILSAELRSLPLDASGSVGDRTKNDPELIRRLERLSGRLEKEWSRLTTDYTAVEARYVLEIHSSLLEAIPPPPSLPLPKVPIGWVPLPDDGWSGLVVFVSPELPLRGTDRTVPPGAALRPRILGPDLAVLAGPRRMDLDYLGRWGVAAYAVLDDRDSFDERIGRIPLQVAARESYDDGGVDLILPEETVDRLLTSTSGRRVLREGRILIVTR